MFDFQMITYFKGLSPHFGEMWKSFTINLVYTIN